MAHQQASMVHLEVVHGEAAVCSELETKSADVSFTNVGTVMKLEPVGGDSGPLASSYHNTTLGEQTPTGELDHECMIIWINVLQQVLFHIVDLKILLGESKQFR